MSGGAMSYFYQDLESFGQNMFDEELEQMVLDLVDVFRDLEWYKSGDTDGETYHRTVAEFKKKWFEGSRDERLHRIVDEEIARLSRHLHTVIGPREVGKTNNQTT